MLLEQRAQRRRPQPERLRRGGLQCQTRRLEHDPVERQPGRVAGADGRDLHDVRQLAHASGEVGRVVDLCLPAAAQPAQERERRRLTLVGGREPVGDSDRQDAVRLGADAQRRQRPTAVQVALGVRPDPGDLLGGHQRREHLTQVRLPGNRPQGAHEAPGVVGRRRAEVRRRRQRVRLDAEGVGQSAAVAVRPIRVGRVGGEHVARVAVVAQPVGGGHADVRRRAAVEPGHAVGVAVRGEQVDEQARTGGSVDGRPHAEHDEPIEAAVAILGGQLDAQRHADALGLLEVHEPADPGIDDQILVGVGSRIVVGRCRVRRRRVRAGGEPLRDRAARGEHHVLVVPVAHDDPPVGQHAGLGGPGPPVGA